MTSVNELNAEQRALYKGRAEGYELGQRNTLEMVRKEKRTLRIMEWTIAMVAGFILAIALQANAETAQTTLTVLEPTQVTAEVPCNPINCPMNTDTANSTAQTVGSESLLSRVWNAILRALQ